MPRIQRITEKFEISQGILYSANNVVDEVIPAEVSSIVDGEYEVHEQPSKYAFQKSNDTLIKVSFESGSQLTYIGQYSFFYCTNLKEVDLTQCHNVNTIHNFAFGYCYSLTTFLLHTIKELKSCAFRSVPLSITIDSKLALC